MGQVSGSSSSTSIDPRCSDALARLWMRRLARRAVQVGRHGEVPVAAVILDAQLRSIGWGVNSRETAANPLGHAELMALQQAAALRRDWRFNDCTLLVTLEPCPMCAGALVQARMGRVVFGAADPKRGALGSLIDLSTDPTAHHRMDVQRGVLAQECSLILRRWFKQHRGQQEGAASGGRSADQRLQGSCSGP